ncbi:MAG: 4-hydroxy-tetrahydrodipicolinate synthase [Clostridia bacterium]|nr:4-hydroxy-tetrahydrodipicolinate synthase [Clostridia bacterium]
MFSGVITALVTPFKKNKQIDYNALQKLLDYQILNNIKNILILGTTGESCTIDFYEREKLIKFTKNYLPSNCKLIVGTGTNNLQQTIKNTIQAKTLGADACLVVAPYYNKCTQNGVVDYYKKISQLNIPYIVYNVPSRTGFNISPVTMLKLCKQKNMVGIKEANSNIEHILEVFNKVGNFTNIYCGNDNLNHIFFSLKAKGTISVISNIFPYQISQSLKSAKNSKIITEQNFELTKLLFVEPNPIPIKYALSKMGLIKNYVRSPLTTLSKKYKNKINQELKKRGL